MIGRVVMVAHLDAATGERLDALAQAYGVERRLPPSVAFDEMAGRGRWRLDPLLFGYGAAAEIRTDDLREWMVMDDYDRLTRLSRELAKAYNGHVRVASGVYRIGSEPRSPRTALHLLGPWAPPPPPRDMLDDVSEAMRRWDTGIVLADGEWTAFVRSPA